MELPPEGIYCVAKSTYGEAVEARAYLPYGIDLSRHKAELAVKYIAVTPTWKHAKGLFLTVTDNPTGEATTTTIHFKEIKEEDSDAIIENLRRQLETHNAKDKDPLIKIVLHASKKYSLFKLRKNAAVQFSLGVAQMFGVQSEHEITYISKTAENLYIPIRPHVHDMTSSTDIYYLKSEEIKSNFLLDNKQDRIIELLHIPGNQTLDFHPTLSYSTLESSVLERLTFILYDSKNEAVKSERPDMYVVCHIKPL